MEQILARKDLAKVTLTLVPHQGTLSEKTSCRVEDVSCVRGRHMEAVVEMARDGMASIAASISSYPVAHLAPGPLSNGADFEQRRS